MDVNELKAKIVKQGMNIGEFCDKCGFVRSTFDRKMSGKSDFDLEDINIIIDALGLTIEEMCNIFFADKVT